MPNTPIDEHSEEFDELAGLYALDVLEGDELARFETHSDGCERCRLMVRLDREALARVALAAPAMDPSPDFKARLMRRAAEELAASAASAASGAGTSAGPDAHPVTPADLADRLRRGVELGDRQRGREPAEGSEPPTLDADRARLGVRIETPEAGGRLRGGSDPAELGGPGGRETDRPERGERGEPLQLRPRPSNVVPLWRRSPWMSALAAVLVVALVTAGAFSYENQTVATYELTGSAAGSARVVVRRSGAAELNMSGVPNPEPGFVYEAWIIPPGKQPVAAGTTDRGDAELKLQGDLRGTTVAITKERGRVDQPTSTPIMATVVQS
jgi:anti-sigma-K factor RskA